MRADINEIIAVSPRQHSDEWYKARLGHFTGSQVGRLMKQGRGNEWSADALSYIDEVASERLINPTIIEIPELFEEYLDCTIATSKAMAWGADNEEKALGSYASIMGCKVTRCGALRHEEVETFYDSPDGVLVEADGVVEVKCPTPKTHSKYLMKIRTVEDLKKIMPEYYWQCHAHMAVTGAGFCDWVTYCPFIKPAIKILRIERDSYVLAQLVLRIKRAEMMAREGVQAARNQSIGGSVS